MLLSVWWKQSNIKTGDGYDSVTDYYPANTFVVGRGDDNLDIVRAIHPIKHVDYSSVDHTNDIGPEIAFLQALRDNEVIPANHGIILVACGENGTGFSSAGGDSWSNYTGVDQHEY